MTAQEVFPFFVGSGRSGTTLVQAIFSAHPELEVAHESQFIPRLAKRAYGLGEGFDGTMFLRDLARLPDFQRMALDPDRLSRGMADVSSYADAIRVVFSEYAAKRGKRLYGDKTPGYILHMELIAELLPEARFVHVVRDGRDVALSYLETRFGPSTLTEAALYWRRRVTEGRRAGLRMGPARYREVRYEELVANPAEVTRELCDFVGIAFDTRMLTYFEDGSRLRSETADPAAHRHLNRPPTTRLRDWRTEMSPGDAAVFDVLAGDALVEFGYARSTSRPSAEALMTAVAGRASWELKRVITIGRRRSALLRRLVPSPK